MDVVGASGLAHSFFLFNKLIKAYLDGAASHSIKNIKRDAAQSAKDNLSYSTLSFAFYF